MSQETCHTCDYDQHCDEIKRDVAYLQMEVQHMEQFYENDAADVSELVILENMPKITPASARRETGVKPGTKADINIGMLNKRGVTVERAAEDIHMRYGPDGENLLAPEFDEQRIREELIEILKMGRKKYKEQFIGPIAEKQLDIEEKTNQFEQECVGDVPEVDLTQYEHARALALALTLKYKYAA